MRYFVIIITLLFVGCVGSNEPEPERTGPLLVWSTEGQPDRTLALKRNLEDFTRQTGIKADVVPIPENQFNVLMTNAAAANKLPDVVAGASAPDALRYERAGTFDSKAAQEVVDNIGPDTFSKDALDLVKVDKGNVAVVPSDGWGQLLFYRKDLFKRAGIAPPKTLADIEAAAKKLNKPGMAGIALAIAPDESFTDESFEHVALAMNCQLINSAGKVRFDSPECVKALKYYANLGKNYSIQTGQETIVPGDQDVDATRDAYFAGKAAMLFWSPFMLDGMAGLRADTRPTCPECRKDPAFLAKNTGLVGPLSSGGEPTQFGLVSGFGVTSTARREKSKQLVEYLMTDGYVRWLETAPQGKYPVRLGTPNDPNIYEMIWPTLQSGVDKKAPLNQFYDDKSLNSLASGVKNFQRWGFPQGEGALIGALPEGYPIANAVANVINGEDPEVAAKRANDAIEKIQRDLNN